MSRDPFLVCTRQSQFSFLCIEHSSSSKAFGKGVNRKSVICCLWASVSSSVRRFNNRPSLSAVQGITWDQEEQNKRHLFWWWWRWEQWWQRCDKWGGAITERRLFNPVLRQLCRVYPLLLLPRLESTQHPEHIPGMSVQGAATFTVSASEL